MSRENIELVRRGLRAGAERPKPDSETLNAVYHPDHVFVPVAVETTEVKGWSGYKAWLNESENTMPWTMEFEGAVEIGTRTVLAEATFHFRGSASD